jgi:hypothetical protein
MLGLLNVKTNNMNLELTKEEIFTLKVAMLFFIKMNGKLTDKTIMEKELIKYNKSIMIKFDKLLIKK